MINLLQRHAAFLRSFHFVLSMCNFFGFVVVVVVIIIIVVVVFVVVVVVVVVMVVVVVLSCCGSIFIVVPLSQVVVAFNFSIRIHDTKALQTWLLQSMIFF